MSAAPRFAPAVLEWLVLRWLVDRDDDAMTAGPDDLAEISPAKATESPDSSELMPPNRQDPRP